MVLLELGTSTAALAFGGAPGPASGALTEYYNGSSWTELNDLNTKHAYGQGAGSLYTAALSFGGYLGPQL